MLKAWGAVMMCRQWLVMMGRSCGVVDGVNDVEEYNYII